MPTTEEPEDYYDVDIALPLEVTVVGAIGKLLGGAFPGSVIYFGKDAPTDHMRFRIPRSEVQDWLDVEDEKDEQLQVLRYRDS